MMNRVELKETELENVSGGKVAPKPTPRNRNINRIRDNFYKLTDSIDKYFKTGKYKDSGFHQTESYEF